jgi:hypothetical protein
MPELPEQLLERVTDQIALDRSTPTHSGALPWAVNHGGSPDPIMAARGLRPWNGPWFRQRGFTPIPDANIGTLLREILDRHSQSLSI